MARQLWPRLGLRRYSGQKTPALDIPKMDFILVIRRSQHNYPKNYYLPILQRSRPLTSIGGWKTTNKATLGVVAKEFSKNRAYLAFSQYGFL